MRTPKPISALKALLLGIPVTLPDGVTYEYVQADGDNRPKIWAIGTRIQFGVRHGMSVEQVKSQIDKALDQPADDARSEKILLNGDMTLNGFILECERMTEEQWVTICANTALMLERIERQEKRERREQEYCLKPCKFDEAGCRHPDCIQTMSCHRQNCPWPERQTGLGSDIWWKGRQGDWEQKKP